ncbi:ABC transporter substrate-binding protein [Halomonas sabkhae]|uniref:ABC transporter substrate-binding protein n=1 Tax=Halomonas sabkhae TaxID=626223 RepID=UPI0025B382BC|nr:ABC transporter substrate-binding protein [Halomonas sabkhae]MDN3523811.1 ABC transporter substrate-binding protein [Halomonas sabkhae]
MKRGLAILLLGGLSLIASADPEPGDTRQQASTLTIQGALDEPHMQPLLDDFRQQHPSLQVHYRNRDTLPLYRDFLAAPDEADVVISSAMPWQYRLANDGYAQPLHTPSAQQWPAWARWRQELFAFTFEPIVMVVHRKLLERYSRPDNHAELLALLRQQREPLTSRVVTYDPRLSGAGYTYAIEESRLSPRYWDLVAALGDVDTSLVATTGEMLEGLAAGRYWIGYNLLGSYARQIVATNPDLEMIIPDDYTLVIQRLAFMPRQAPHPENARRFLDYLISRRGQAVIAGETSLGAIHPDLSGPGTAQAWRTTHGDALRPLTIGPGLLATLDELKRQALLSRWQREFKRDDGQSRKAGNGQGVRE